MEYICDKTFSKTDFTVELMARAEYDACRFERCRFMECDMNGIIFRECVFIECDLSLANVAGTVWDEVEFVGCKLLGVRFDESSKMGNLYSFTRCMLDNASFYSVKMPRTKFTECRLADVDFVEANLKASKFDECDLTGAQFENTILERADFATSKGYQLAPELNMMRGAKFSLYGLPGLVAHHGIEIDE